MSSKKVGNSKIKRGEIMKKMIELSFLTEDQIPLIHDLFLACYPKRIDFPIEHWKWLFNSPFGYIASGIFINNELRGFYSALCRDEDVVCYSAMIHPENRGNGLISKVANHCFNQIKAEYPYKSLFLFANKNIKDIYLKKLGFINAGQIIEYEIEAKEPKDYRFNPKLYISGYKKWRYRFGPKIYEIFQNNTNYVVLSKYEDRVQIVDFRYWNEWVKHIAITWAIKHLYHKITLWNEKPIKGAKERKLPIWLMFKELKKCNMVNIMKDKKIRMGDSDVF